MKDVNLIDEIRSRSQAFFETKSFVHISTFKDVFYNGYVKEMSSDFMIFTDRLNGDVLIFFREVKGIEFFKEVKK